MRQHEAIDLLKLYFESSPAKWNAWLARCKDYHNLAELKKVYYGLQAGMDDLAKNKMNSDKLSTWFLRLQRSIEKTAKAIIREKNPMPGDNALDKATSAKMLEAKRKRDREFEAFIRKAAY